MTNWYELCEPQNGIPVAYFKINSQLQKFMKNYSLKGNIEKINNPSPLEYAVKLGEKTLASFEFEGHAINYNQMFFKGNGFIEPNPLK